MALEIPGKLPSTANGKIAVKAAWQIECESGRRASGEEVMARLQHWADNGDEPGVLIRSNKKKRYVVWLTQKYEERDYSLEACQKTVERWNESREEPTLDRH